MRCEDVNAWLDRLMDDELTDDQRRELEQHGETCPRCAEQIRATLQMKALFGEMEPEVDVPLKAQAAWRDAVRQEAGRARRKRLYRFASAAAAVVVVMAGVGWGLSTRRNAPEVQSKAVLMEASENEVVYESAMLAEEPAEAMDFAVDTGAGDSAVLESDGQLPLMAASSAMLEESVPTREIAMAVDSVDEACERIADLVAEYEGEVDVQRIEDGGANLYVRMPGESVAEFINAIEYLNRSGETLEAPEFDGQSTASLLISLNG